MTYKKVRSLLLPGTMSGRCALGVTFMVTLATTSLGGCVVPIPASPEDSDGGARVLSTPFVISSIPAMPGPLHIFVDIPMFTVSLTIRDADLDDLLYVRVFRDYAKDPRPPLLERTFINDKENGTQDRPGIIDPSNWCTGVALGELITITVVVADEPFDTTAEAEKNYTKVTRDGRSSSQSWVATCELYQR